MRFDAHSTRVTWRRRKKHLDHRMVVRILYQTTGGFGNLEVPIGKNMITIILVVLLLLAIGGGGWGHARYGYASWSPVGVILVVLLLLYFFGYIHR